MDAYDKSWAAWEQFKLNDQLTRFMISAQLGTCQWIPWIFCESQLLLETYFSPMRRAHLTPKRRSELVHRAIRDAQRSQLEFVWEDLRSWDLTSSSLCKHLISQVSR